MEQDVLAVPMRYPAAWLPRSVVGLSAAVAGLTLFLLALVQLLRGGPLEWPWFLGCYAAVLLAAWWGTEPGRRFTRARPRWRIRVSPEGVVVQRGLPPDLVPVELAWTDCEHVFLQSVRPERGPELVVMGFQPRGGGEPLLWVMDRKHGSDVLPVRDWILAHHPEVGIAASLRMVSSAGADRPA